MTNPDEARVKDVAERLTRTELDAVVSAANSTCDLRIHFQYAGPVMRSLAELGLLDKVLGKDSFYLSEFGLAVREYAARAPRPRRPRPPGKVTVMNEAIPGARVRHRDGREGVIVELHLPGWVDWLPDNYGKPGAMRTDPSNLVVMNEEMLPVEQCELLPCPFCGQPPEIVDRDKIFVFRCPETSPCFGSGLANYGLIDRKAGAIAAWNTRIPTARERVLEEALARIDHLVEDNITENDLPHRAHWHGEIIEGAAAEMLHSILRGMQRLARTALNPGDPK